MVEFVNAFTGSQMWVADERVEEYKAAGHKPVAVSSAATMPTEEPKKATSKKGTTKKVEKKK